MKHWFLGGLAMSLGFAVGCGPDDGAIESDADSEADDDDDDDDDAADDDDDDSSDDDDDDDDDSSGDDDDDDDSSGDDDDDDDSSGDDDDDDATDGCPPTPIRMVIFGDSITACFGAGGKQSDDCSPKRLHTYFSENYAPVSYENLAVEGAVTRDVINFQLPQAAGQPGHAIVVIFVGGNDLAPYIISSDEEAINGWENNTGPDIEAAWQEIFAFLEDPQNFPDGVTLVMNTQYDPFDNCTAPPYNLSQTKVMLLHTYNEQMTDRAASKDYAHISEQHDPYLGHGHHFNIDSCPYYAAGSEAFMFDVIHPNPAGHHQLGDIMAGTVDEIFADCE